MREFLLFMSVISSGLGYELPCLFKMKTNWTFDNFYHCDLTSDIESNSSDVVTEITGLHEKGKSLVDVSGFTSYRKILRYFPQELDKFFKARRIFCIRIDNAELKEIHQKDLSPFSMYILSLHTNHIQVLEKDLFKFNPALGTIILTNNRIKSIAQGVFNYKPTPVQTLLLVNNTCISDYGYVTRDFKDFNIFGGINTLDVQRLLREIEKKCGAKETRAEVLTGKDNEP